MRSQQVIAKVLMRPYQFDMLSPLLSWVEQGIPPASVKASVRGAGNVGGVNEELPKDWSSSRSRPLCA